MLMFWFSSSKCFGLNRRGGGGQPKVDVYGQWEEGENKQKICGYLLWIGPFVVSDTR